MEEPILTQKRSGVAPLVGTLLAYVAVALVAAVLYYGITFYFSQQVDAGYEQQRVTARLEKLKALHDKDASVLTTTGWIDEAKGITHIPIQEGMKLAIVALKDKKPADSGVAVPAPVTISADPAAASAAPAVEAAPAASPAPATGGAHP